MNWNERITLTVSMLLVLTAAVALPACRAEQPAISIDFARAEGAYAGPGNCQVFFMLRNDGGADAVTGLRTSVAGAKASFAGEAGALRIGAKTVTELKPTGTHILVENLPRDAANGFAFTLTLVFERSGERTIPLTLSLPPRSGGMSDGRGMSVRD